MASKNISKKVKKNIAKVALVSALLGVGYEEHTSHPTTVPSVYYIITDPFVTTLTEKRIEKEFGIDYEGDSNEERQRILEENLQKIYETNPALLTHCEKIVLHSEAVENSALVEPFLNYSGTANRLGTIELISLTLSETAHELAHLKYFHASKEFDDQLEYIFGNTYKKDLKNEKGSVWNDGSVRPRNGFVRPYGANNSHENVATYVEMAYIPSFWEDQQLQQSDKYLKTLSLLQEYDFISLKQFEDIKSTLDKNKNKP